MNRSQAVSLLIFFAMLWATVRYGGGGEFVPTLKNPTAGHYVYEKDETQVPAGVQSAMNRYQTELGLQASVVDIHVVDGDGQTPEQYATAFPAAKEHGLPCLVILASDEVLKIIADPRTEEQAMEAVQ